jgi:uncharacterized protein (UPF0332 family)
LTALLLQRGRYFSRHTALRSALNRDFARKGSIEAALANFYNDLFDLRRSSDYLGFFEFDDDQVHRWCRQARLFLTRIDELLSASS